MTSYPDIPRLTSSMPAPNGIGLAGLTRLLLNVGALSRDSDIVKYRTLCALYPPPEGGRSYGANR
jgi:hypothetical protein